MDSDSIARLETRLDRMEATLARVAEVLDQVRPTVAMATDIADEWVASRVGGDQVEQRLASLEGAVLKLTEPGTLDALVRLAEQAPKLERVTTLAASFDDTVGMAADMADEFVKERVGGAAMDQRLAQGVDTLVRLSDPDVMRTVTALMEQLPKLDRLLGIAVSFDDTVAMGADIADEWIAENIGGDGLEERAQQGMHTLVRLSDPRILQALGRLAEQAPQLERVVDLAAHFDDHVAMAADIVEDFIRQTVGGDGLEVRVAALRGTAVELSRPEVLDALTSLASLAPRLQRSAKVAAELDDFVDASVRALEKEPKPVGAFGLLGALSDPDIQRGLGRLLNVTRELGRPDGQLPALAK